MLERRRPLRRALGGGVIFGVVGALPLALLEVVYVLLVRKPEFYSYGEGAHFCLYVFLLLVSAGGLVGAVEGAVALGVSTLTKLVAKQRLAEPPWMAWFYSLLALPAIAVVASRVSEGPIARQLPASDLIAVGAGVALLVVTYGAARLIIGVRELFRIRRWGPRQGLILMFVPLLSGVALYHVDHCVLADMYGFIHVGLCIGSVACFQLAAGVVYSAYRSRWHWLGRVLEPSVTLMVVIVCVAGLAWSLDRVGHYKALRYVSYRHSVIQSKLLAIATSVGVIPPPPRRLGGATLKGAVPRQTD